MMGKTKRLLYMYRMISKQALVSMLLLLSKLRTIEDERMWKQRQ